MDISALAAMPQAVNLLDAGSLLSASGALGIAVVLGLLVGVVVAWALMSLARRTAPPAERLHDTPLRPLVARR